MRSSATAVVAVTGADVRSRTSATVVLNVVFESGCAVTGRSNVKRTDGHVPFALRVYDCVVVTGTEVVPFLSGTVNVVTTLANEPSSSNMTDALTLFDGYAEDCDGVTTTFFGAEFGFTVHEAVAFGPRRPDVSVACAPTVNV